MELKGKQIEELRVALQRAFLDRAKLKRLLREELDVRMDEEIGGNTLTETVAELIDWAEERGRLADLVSAAFRRNPGNPRLRSFVESFGILPSDAGIIEGAYGPEFDWRGSTEPLELQGFWRRKPELWDLAFLSRGVDQASSVCRIEVEGQGAVGTGVLISRDLLLTNYHVLEDAIQSNLQNIARVRLCFRRLTTEAGAETIGQTFGLAENPIVCSSPTQLLDYALLRIESSILSAEAIRPVEFAQISLTKGNSIHILQHPNGESMKIAFGTNGVTGVYEKEGLIQYISQTSTGSSGSPCFNDDWRLVALHHAQRATSFGVVCEGILFSAIYPQISDVLT